MSTTAVHRGGITNTSPARWADLPDDLLGMIRLRVTSIRDRVLLAAVCTPWHAAASRLPPPLAVPLLLLSPHGRSRKKHLCGPDGAWILHVPSKTLHRRFIESHQGGWIAATDDRTLVIVNLFSGAEVPLSAKQHTIASISANRNRGSLQRSLCKIIFSEHPTSSNGCTLAGLRSDRFTIVLCRIGCSASAWSEKSCFEEPISDIAFYNGDLYGFANYNEILIKFEIGTEGDGTPVITSIHKMAIQRRDGLGLNKIGYSSYIIELNGELAMVVRNRWPPNKEVFFRVFKLADAKENESYKHKWELTSLSDHALFMGPTWSRAVHVPLGESRGMDRNHIYYSCSTWLNDYEAPADMVYSVTTDDGDRMCCRADQNIGNGVKMTRYHTMGCYSSAMWIYPPDL